MTKNAQIEHAKGRGQRHNQDESSVDDKPGQPKNNKKNSFIIFNIILNIKILRFLVPKLPKNRRWQSSNYQSFFNLRLFFFDY